MTAYLVRISIVAVRSWTRVYTWGLPRAIRDIRRAEIESDLCECQRDDTGTLPLPIQIIGRLVFGIFDDMAWRREQMPSTGPRLVIRRVAVGVIAAAALVLLVGSAVLPMEPPLAPNAPDLRWRITQYPPPPPPPPPPCEPAGSGRKLLSPCTPFR